MTKQDLLPCPFCGGEADFFYRQPDDEFSVGCKDCGAYGEYFSYLNPERHEEATKVWNTRPTEDSLQSKVDMLVEGLEFYADENNWKTKSRGFAAQYDPIQPEAHIKAWFPAQKTLQAVKGE